MVNERWDLEWPFTDHLFEFTDALRKQILNVDDTYFSKKPLFQKKRKRRLTLTHKKLKRVLKKRYKNPLYKPLFRRLSYLYKHYRSNTIKLDLLLFITSYSGKLFIVFWFILLLEVRKLLRWYVYLFRQILGLIVNRNKLACLKNLGKRPRKKPTTYVIMKNLKLSFKQVIGVDNVFPYLCEMVVVLKESPFLRKYKHRITDRKGFLFVGPPGTGKTFLVKALAGEAKVPIVVESGSRILYKLNNMYTRANIIPLLKTFTMAKKLAPCILFIDEIDTIAAGRKAVEHSFNTFLAHEIFSSYNPASRVSDQQKIQEIDTTKKGLKAKTAAEEIREKLVRKALVKNLNERSYAALVELLIQMDNLAIDSGVLVIGATNRPQVLDPALVRPGRFELPLHIKFPPKAKRIEILQMYSSEIKKIKTNSDSIEDAYQTNMSLFLKKLNKLKEDESRQETSSIEDPQKGTKILPQKGTGVQITEETTLTEEITPALPDFSDFYWEYFGNLTFNFNAADLATVINHSSTKAILQNTNHTIETFEEGIDYVTTSPQNKINEKEDITTFAYYQVGKAFLHTLLPLHPNVNNVRLFSRQENFRVQTQSKFTSFMESRPTLETRLIGLYAGKAAELLFFSSNYQTKKQNTNTNKSKQKAKISQSSCRAYGETTVGVEDLATAKALAYFLVENYYFFSKNIGRQLKSKIFTTKTTFEFRYFDEFVALEIFAKHFKKLVSGVYASKRHRPLFDPKNIKKHQIWYLKSLWQEQITGKLIPWYFTNYEKREWSRIYLPILPSSDEGQFLKVVPYKFFHDAQTLPSNLLTSDSKESLFFQTRNYSRFNIFAERNHDIKTRKSNLYYKKNISTTSKRFTNRQAGLQKERNVRLKVLPKIFGKQNNHQIKNQQVTWNDLYQSNTDYISHALIYTCFNQAFSLLDENRELLDYLVNYLMRFKILRQDKINEIFFGFGLPTSYKNQTESKIKNKQTTYASQQKQNKDQLKETLLVEKLKNKEKINEIFDKNWGKNSRRVFSRFFTFSQYPVPQYPFGVVSFQDSIISRYGVVFFRDSLYLPLWGKGYKGFKEVFLPQSPVPRYFNLGKTQPPRRRIFSGYGVLSFGVLSFWGVPRYFKTVVPTTPYSENIKPRRGRIFSGYGVLSFGVLSFWGVSRYSVPTTPYPQNIQPRRGRLFSGYGVVVFGVLSFWGKE